MAYTKMNGVAELANVATAFDKDIKKTEDAIKIEKDKKKKATLEKNLVQLKADKSKAQGEKLVELQTKNSKEAEQLFKKIQDGFIKAGMASGKAKKAFEEFSKNPTDGSFVEQIRAAVDSIKDIPQELADESNAFVEAQGDLRGDGVFKGLISKDADAFKKLRNQLIGDNKTFTAKKDGIRSILTQISTLLATAEKLNAKGTKDQEQLRKEATTQLTKLEKLLKDLENAGPGMLKRKAENIINTKLDANSMVTFGKEMVTLDKKVRDDIKTAQTLLGTVTKLVATITGGKDLETQLGEAKEAFDSQVQLLKETAELERAALTAVQTAQKK
jgi:hypothetical protein